MPILPTVISKSKVTWGLIEATLRVKAKQCLARFGIKTPPNPLKHSADAVPLVSGTDHTEVSNGAPNLPVPAVADASQITKASEIRSTSSTVSHTPPPMIIAGAPIASSTNITAAA